MRAALLPLVLGAGCSFSAGAGSRDAGVDAVVPDAPCAFSSLFDTCALGGGSAADLVITGNASYDTTAGKLFDGGVEVPIHRMPLQGQEGMVEVVVVHDFHLLPNARLVGAGTLPLAVVAFGSITLDDGATITVGKGGAGARTSCPDGAVAGADHDGGGGGGGGGGYGAPGGAGGAGDSDGDLSDGGPGGAAATAAPEGPLGGCPGANGGAGDSQGGAGGAGGGALYLVAAGPIGVGSNAVIDAGGAGGGPGTVAGGLFTNGDAGGGGGGSGGMILLEAPQVRSQGVLAANGGGGGAGSGGGTQGGPGEPGPASTARANGGTDGSGSGTPGGAGGARPNAPGDSVTGLDKGGGGGGGGGVGYIIVRSPDAVIASASPAAI